MPRGRKTTEGYPKIGERIVAAMRYLNLSGREVARWLRVSEPSVSNWRSGKTLPDPKHAVLLARRLQVSVDWMMNGIPHTSGEGSQPVLDKLLTEIAKRFRSDCIDLLASDEALREIVESYAMDRVSHPPRKPTRPPVRKK